MITRKLYRFSIDKVNERFVSGWCFHRLFNRKPLSMRIAADDHTLGKVDCLSYRKDLMKKQLHPTGLCGFDFNLPDDFNPRHFQNLHFYVMSHRSPLTTIPCINIETLGLDTSKKIFFMHIPKTAGSSFNAFLRLCYPASHYSSHIERLEEKERRKLIGVRNCISGHLPWHQIKELTENSDYQLYTIIRDPFRQLHSHFNYVRRVQTDAEHEVHFSYKHNETIRALARKLNTVNFSNDNEIEELANNLKDYQLDFFDNLQTRYFLDYRPEKVTMMDFENAKNVIDRFKLIGLTEHYEIFMNRFCEEMQLPQQTQMEQSNKSDYYKLFDHSIPSTRSILSPLVEVDMLLYQYILERFWSS